jgi:DNA (cytosine-5)-methyltransferase 1
MGGVVPTLNVFDNAHETRATVIVFYGNRVDDIRIQDDKINTLQARMGTGGNNMPMVYQEGEDETVAYSIREDAQADTFSATPTDTALALQAHQPSVQSHHAQLFVAQTFDTYNQTTSDTAQTLRSGTDMDKMGVVFNPTVRRLTPTECERLQGFPDGWTEGQADSHRYKQLGNAVAVPVVDWLISRLVASSESMESSTE